MSWGCLCVSAPKNMNFFDVDEGAREQPDHSAYTKVLSAHALGWF